MDDEQIKLHKYIDFDQKILTGNLISTQRLNLVTLLSMTQNVLTILYGSYYIGPESSVKSISNRFLYSGRRSIARPSIGRGLEFLEIFKKLLV